MAQHGLRKTQLPLSETLVRLDGLSVQRTFHSPVRRSNDSPSFSSSSSALLGLFPGGELFEWKPLALLMVSGSVVKLLDNGRLFLVTDYSGLDFDFSEFCLDSWKIYTFEQFDIPR